MNSVENNGFDYPVDGVLDLHMFLPAEAKSALVEYLAACRRQGVLRVRIIHGKGSGVLRRIVRAYLGTCPFVREFSTPQDTSGWGATVAVLDPPAVGGTEHERMKEV